MNELKEKEAQAIKVLRTFEPEEGYVLAYSGGKDSDCIKILAQLAGVKFEAVHNLTTADAPETMPHLRLCSISNRNLMCVSSGRGTKMETTSQCGI